MNTHDAGGEQMVMTSHAKHDPYWSLLLSLGVSFAVMFVVMYAMVDRRSHAYFNLSNVYMTGLMAGSMVPVMLVTMRGMFSNKKLNAMLWVSAAMVLGLFWGLLRTEAGVGDRQFLRAMIPHHSAAVQMCREASLTDPRVRELCGKIVTSQEQEIVQMKTLLDE